MSSGGRTINFYQEERRYCHLPFPEIAMGEIPSETAVREQFEEYQRKVDKNKQKELRMDKLVSMASTKCKELNGGI